MHSHEASPLKSAYVTAKHALLGLARVLAKEGAKHHVRSHVVCPGFVRTPLVDKQIPEQAKELGISEEDVVKNVMRAARSTASSQRCGRRGPDGFVPGSFPPQPRLRVNRSW